MSKPREFWISPQVVKTNPRSVVYEAHSILTDPSDIHVREVTPQGVKFREAFEEMEKSVLRAIDLCGCFEWCAKWCPDCEERNLVVQKVQEAKND
jgi:thiol-disulfide isomerase/thioredoxin